MGSVRAAPTDKKHNAVVTWVLNRPRVAYIVDRFELAYHNPKTVLLRQNIFETFYDTRQHLPSNLYQLLRGTLQTMHIPSAMMCSAESPIIREVVLATLRDHLKFALIATGTVNTFKFFSFMSEGNQSTLARIALAPVASRMFINNVIHTTNIAKVFSEETPNNKNFKTCECGCGAQNSADVESVFRFVSEQIFVLFVSFIPYVGDTLSFLLLAIANAQYMIELKLSTVGMCSECRRDIFVNNSMYVLGYNLGLMLLYHLLKSQVKEYLPILKNDYTDEILFRLLMQLFTMVAFLQHGPFQKKAKGKDLLSRDYFYFTHAVINFIVREAADHILPRLEDPLYRARQSQNMRNIVYYLKLPAVVFTNTDMYKVDRWLHIPALSLLLKCYTNDIKKYLEPVDLIKNEMKKLPSFISSRLVSMSTIIAYAIYILKNINVTDKQLETLLNVLNDKSFNMTKLLVESHLIHLNPATDETEAEEVKFEGGSLSESLLPGDTFSPARMPERLNEAGEFEREDGKFLSDEAKSPASLIITSYDGEQSPLAEKDPAPEPDDPSWQKIYEGEANDTKPNTVAGVSLLRLRNLFPVAGMGASLLSYSPSSSPKEQSSISVPNR